MGDAKRKGSMSIRDHVWYINMAAWFNINLANPSCFDEPICDNVRFRAQSWFKCQSFEVLDKSLLVVQLLRMHGIHVNVKWSDLPGIVIYEDEAQVVVIPQD